MQVPICPSPHLAFMRSCCFHSIPFPLLIPPPMKVSWTRQKGDNYFLSCPRSIQALSISQSTIRSLRVITISTIHSACEGHCLLPFVPACSPHCGQRNFYWGQRNLYNRKILSWSHWLCCSLSPSLSAFSPCLNLCSGLPSFLRETRPFSGWASMAPGSFSHHSPNLISVAPATLALS